MRPLGWRGGEEIPCVIAVMAEEFGDPIPVGPFAIIGDESIGEGIVATLQGHRSRAVLMQSHGPFTIGKDPRAAVKAAVIVEDVARTCTFLANSAHLSQYPLRQSKHSSIGIRTLTDNHPRGASSSTELSASARRATQSDAGCY